MTLRTALPSGLLDLVPPHSHRPQKWANALQSASTSTYDDKVVVGIGGGQSVVNKGLLPRDV